MIKWNLGDHFEDAYSGGRMVGAITASHGDKRFDAEVYDADLETVAAASFDTLRAARRWIERRVEGGRLP